MRSVLKIVWIICRHVLELAIIVFILLSIRDRGASLIVGVLELIYATIRAQGLSQGVALMQMWEAIEQQFYALRRLAGDKDFKPADSTDDLQLGINLVTNVIFLVLLNLICLLHIF